MQLKRIGISLGAVLFSTIFLFVGFSSTVHAANPGTILTGFNEALVTRDGTTINFGLFENNDTPDVLVYDTYLKGYAWGEKVGWISLNCANETVNNCADNGNFHVVNTTSGHLSGFAWGQKTGWINFGPFSNPTNDAERVVIDPSNGEFDGYAWGQKIGWIKFDCDGGTACVKTDWRPTSNSGGGGGVVIIPPSSQYVCSNGFDDDGDGLADLSDAGCENSTDNDETNIPGEEPTIYACSDFIDNDGDGYTDMSDPGCEAVNDNSEYDFIPPPTCLELGTCPPPPTCESSNTCQPPPTENCVTLGTCPPPPGSDDITPPGPPPGGGQPPPQVPPPTTGSWRPTIPPGVERFFETLTGYIPTIPGAISNSFAFIKNISFTRFLGLLGIAAALASIPLAFWRSLFAFFYKNKRRPWGTVYDSVTKQPLDPAYVVLKDMAGKDVATSITDLDGRYGFLQSPGTYTMIANKTHYEFPSRQLAGKSRDELYDDLYFGTSFTVQNDSDIVMKNIPMDPIGFDWNQFAKEQQHRMRFYHRRDVILSRLSNIVFYIGFAISILALIVDQSLLNIIVVGLYIVLFWLRNTVFRQKAHGMVTDRATGLPISFAIIRIYFASLNQEVAHAVTTVSGKYYKLIANGTYYVSIEKKNDDGTYTPVFKSEPIEVKNGAINQVFMI